MLQRRPQALDTHIIRQPIRFLINTVQVGNFALQFWGNASGVIHLILWRNRYIISLQQPWIIIAGNLGRNLPFRIHFHKPEGFLVIDFTDAVFLGVAKLIIVTWTIALIAQFGAGCFLKNRRRPEFNFALICLDCRLHLGIVEIGVDFWDKLLTIFLPKISEKSCG